MSKIKLLNCPFCGGIAKMETQIRLFDSQIFNATHIECQVCHAQSKQVWNTQYDDKPNEREKEVIDSWNKRKPMQYIVERLEREKVSKMFVGGRSNGKTLKTGINYGIATAIEIVKEVGGMNET